jgi:hypothetical protein
MHAPRVHSFLVHLIDRLLIPVGFGKRGRAGIAVLDYPDISLITSYSRGIRAGHDDALHLWLGGSSFQERLCPSHRRFDKVVWLFDIPVKG